MNSMFHSLSNGEGRVWDPDDVPAEAVDGVGVDVVDPLVGGLPDDDPDPEREVGGHQVDEPEPGEQPEPLHDHGRVDEQEVHLKEGEQSLDLIFHRLFQSYIYSAPDLQYGVCDDDVVHAVSFVHGGVHRDLQTDEDQGAQAEHCMDTVVN